MLMPCEKIGLSNGQSTTLPQTISAEYLDEFQYKSRDQQTPPERSPSGWEEEEEPEPWSAKTEDSNLLDHHHTPSDGTALSFSAPKIQSFVVENLVVGWNTFQILVSSDETQPQAYVLLVERKRTSAPH